jgi:hypothetical protein
MKLKVETNHRLPSRQKNSQSQAMTLFQVWKQAMIPFPMSSLMLGQQANPIKKARLRMRPPRVLLTKVPNQNLPVTKLCLLTEKT